MILLLVNEQQLTNLMIPKNDGRIRSSDTNEILKHYVISNKAEIFPDYCGQLKFLISRFIKVLTKSSEEDKELINKNKTTKLKIEFMNKNRPTIQQDQTK